MFRRIWKYLQLGWRVIREAHTIFWLFELFGVTLSAIILGILAFYGEHSPAILTVVFVFCLMAFTAIILLILGYRRDVNVSNANLNSSPNVPAQSGEINARTERRYIMAADAIRYIADESEWGARLRAAPPNTAGRRQQPRFAAIDEFVRAAREGEIDVFGRLNQTGEHLLISQQYWLYATIDIGSVIGATQPAVTSPISSDLGQRELFTPYDGLCVERSDLIRVWPERRS
jgi:hypothetical protein